ncbi:MAG: trypsin-like serine peptidase [Bdellovibrionota bacterium]
MFLFFAGLFSYVEMAHSNFSGILPSVIYGEDGRQDLFEVKEPLKSRQFDSSVALINEKYLKQSDDGKFELIGASYQEKNQLCSTERFVEQNVLASCSGVLIDEETVLTAGHCIQNLQACRSLKFVFGFNIAQRGAEPDSVKASDVYGCGEIIERKVNDKTKLDFALVRLDRPVEDHVPAEMRSEGNIRKGEPVFAIGYPRGLPAKIADGGIVRTVDGRKKEFLASIDAMEMNSGSPVYNGKTGLLEGILLDGEEDFSFDTKGKCYFSHWCKEESCSGEGILRISEVQKYLNE